MTCFRTMKLVPLDNAGLIRTVSGWLSDERNYRWLDFGNGMQALDPVVLAFMAQKDNHLFRVFTSDESDEPIGVVGLTNIKRDFRTATIWIVLGEKRYSLKGFARSAASRLLTHAFEEMRLNAVDAWAVSCNYASLKMIRELNFRPVGVQRQCHIMKDRVYDRILFDLLAEEHDPAIYG